MLLGDDPGTIFGALGSAISDGASLDDLGRSLAYAAALRVAQFGTANEHGDWDSAHHVFTYCNAVHQGLKRIAVERNVAGLPEASRGILYGAAAIYLIRYLNVPPARLPGEGDDGLNALPSTPKRSARRSGCIRSSAPGRGSGTPRGAPSHSRSSA